MAMLVSRRRYGWCWLTLDEQDQRDESECKLKCASKSTLSDQNWPRFLTLLTSNPWFFFPVASLFCYGNVGIKEEIWLMLVDACWTRSKRRVWTRSTACKQIANKRGLVILYYMDNTYVCFTGYFKLNLEFNVVCDKVMMLVDDCWTRLKIQIWKLAKKLTWLSWSTTKRKEMCGVDFGRCKFLLIITFFGNVGAKHVLYDSTNVSLYCMNRHFRN